MMDIWAIYSFGLLWIPLLWTWVYKGLFVFSFVILLGIIYLGVETYSNTTFWGTEERKTFEVFFSSLTTGCLCKYDVMECLRIHYCHLEPRGLRSWVHPPQPVKCSRSWFSIPDTWYWLGEAIHFGASCLNPWYLLTKNSKSFPKAPWFSGQPQN